MSEVETVDAEVTVTQDVDALFQIVRDGRPLATLYLTHQGQIGGCLTDEEYRRDGLMSDLIETALEYAVHHHDEVVLGTQEDNEEMQATAEKFTHELDKMNGWMRYTYDPAEVTGVK